MAIWADCQFTLKHMMGIASLNPSYETRTGIHMATLPALPELAPGLYRHYKGNDYEVIAVARHSETLEPVVVYRALYGEGGLLVRPYAMFCEEVVVDGRSVRRFAPIG